MVRLFMTALFALAVPAEHASAATPAALDRQCYRLMAEFAGDEDPQVRAAGLVGAQYFLGRLDAAGAAAPENEEPRAEPARERLVRRCTEIMSAGGRDFRALGERLVRAPDRA